MPPKIEWHEPEVRALVEARGNRALTKLAFQVLGQAKINIQQNGQIDTGFMLNSGYVITDSQDTFFDVEPAGYFESKRTGNTVWRETVETPPPREPGEAIVGFAADYALYQELDISFLHAALEVVAAQAGGILTGSFEDD